MSLRFGKETQTVLHLRTPQNQALENPDSLTITNAQFTPLTGKCMMIRTTTFALRYEPTNSQTIGHYATQQNTGLKVATGQRPGG